MTSKQTSAKDNAYFNWLQEITDWSDKHGISRKQAISILFFDNLKEPRKNGLYWANADDFAFKYMNELE